MGHAWVRPYEFARSQPVTYVPVESVIVIEVSVDVAWEHGRWRHPPRLLRTRLDLEPEDVDLLPVPFT